MTGSIGKASKCNDNIFYLVADTPITFRRNNILLWRHFYSVVSCLIASYATKTKRKLVPSQESNLEESYHFYNCTAQIGYQCHVSLLQMKMNVPPANSVIVMMKT